MIDSQLVREVVIDVGFGVWKLDILFSHDVSVWSQPQSAILSAVLFSARPIPAVSRDGINLVNVGLITQRRRLLQHIWSFPLLTMLQFGQNFLHLDVGGEDETVEPRS